ncbi:MAG: hypothetical protein KAI55_00155, partial [Candidatus Aenigmarchaeota archaeon]|nr:hypothetical protein [Candidatus Aenigmarchaeota archaeon]
EGSMYFNFDNFYEENTVTGTIDIISNNITNTATLNIIIIANLSDSINNIIYKKEELALRLSNLNSANEKDDLITTMETMQLDISELNSDYSNKKYLDAKEKIALIESDMYSLEESIRSLEQSELPSNDSHYCGDGVCNADENEEVCVEDCTSESSTTDPPVSGSTTWKIILGVLIAIIILIVAATSLVPEDYDDEDDDDDYYEYEDEEDGYEDDEE